MKIDVPAAWANAEDVVAQHNLEGKPELVKQVKNILFPVDKMDGDSLPVSTFVDHVDGQFELGAAAYEKRGVAVAVPEWDSAKCIQCGNCAYVCPHATIRTVALTDEEAKNAPAAAKIVPVKAGKGKGVYHNGHLSARLHGLRRLRRCLPRKGSGYQDGSAGNAAGSAGRFRLLREQGLREEGASDCRRQGQPVPQAAA